MKIGRGKAGLLRVNKKNNNKFVSMSDLSSCANLKILTTSSPERHSNISKNDAQDPMDSMVKSFIDTVMTKEDVSVNWKNLNQRRQNIKMNLQD